MHFVSIATREDWGSAPVRRVIDHPTRDRCNSPMSWPCLGITCFSASSRVYIRSTFLSLDSRLVTPPHHQVSISCPTSSKTASRCAHSSLCVLLTPFADTAQASETLAALAKVFEGFSDEEKKAQIKKAGVTTIRSRSHDH